MNNNNVLSDEQSHVLNGLIDREVRRKLIRDEVFELGLKEGIFRDPWDRKVDFIVDHLLSLE